MGCFVSAAPSSIFMGRFTKTTENLNQRASLSTIQTQDSLNAVCDYKASYHITNLLHRVVWQVEHATCRQTICCVCLGCHQISNPAFITLGTLTTREMK
jgi:hypothetical protein